MSKNGGINYDNFVNKRNSEMGGLLQLHNKSVSLSSVQQNNKKKSNLMDRS